MAMPPPPVYENVEVAMIFAREALELQHYEDLVSAMESVVKMTVGELTREQKMMVEVGYRKVMDAKLKERWNLESIRRREEEFGIPRDLAQSRHYIKNVETEMEKICRDARNIIHARVLFYSTSSEDQVYYRTMIGDLYRYRAAFKGDNWINFAFVASHEYQRAEEIAVRVQLPGNNFIRLHLACSFSTHCYLILCKPQRALAILNTALDAALINWPVLPLDEPCLKLAELLTAKLHTWFGPPIDIVGGGGEASSDEECWELARNVYAACMLQQVSNNS